MTAPTMFLYAIAKVLLITGIGPGIAIAVFLERRGTKIVAVGIEKVSEGGQLATATKQQLAAREELTKFDAASWATSPPRKVRTAS